MIYTFSVLSTCDGGCHHTVQIIEDGIETDIMMIDINMSPPISEGLRYLLHQRIKGLITSAERIAAIESLEVES